MTAVTVEVLEPQVEPTLDELAATANREYGLSSASLESSFEHAVLCGEALLAAHAVVSPGEWITWLDQNCLMRSVTSAQQFMRLAEYQDVLRARGWAALGRSGALRQLQREGIRRKTGRAVGNGSKSDYPPEVHAAAKELRDKGATLRAIADVLGVSIGTALRWTDADAAKRQSELARASAQRRYAARRALAEKERQQAIKRALVKEGEAFNEAYAVITRLDGLLGQARKEAQTREKRAAINEAHALRDKMMDTLVRALGVA